MTPEGRINELLEERSWLKVLVSSQMDQIANLMLLISQANQTAQQLSATILSLNSPPTPLNLAEDPVGAISYEDEDNYEDYAELINLSPIEEPEFDTLDEDDLALLGIELPK